MAKWSDLKPQYQNQTNFWVKVPKDSDLFTEENKKNDFKDIECFQFLFKQFDKNQIFDLLTNLGESEKDIVKKQINKFIENIIDWKNVKVDDILKDGNQEELEYDKDAVDEFIANNFWVVPFLVQQINDEILKRKSKINSQKKT